MQFIRVISVSCWLLCPVTISSVTMNIYIQNVFEPLHDIFTPCKPAIFHQANGLIEVSRFFFMFCVSLFVCSIYFLSSSYFCRDKKDCFLKNIRLFWIFSKTIGKYRQFFRKPSILFVFLELHFPGDYFSRLIEFFQDSNCISLKQVG